MKTGTRVVSQRAANTVYIGRAGRGEDGTFGNPFVVGKLCSRCSCFHMNAASTLPCYRAYLEYRVSVDPAFRVKLLSLRGRLLWCPGLCKKKGGPCHGDVIVEWLEENA